MSTTWIAPRNTEARHVHAADMDASLDFYVRLRCGASEVRTDTSRSNAAPKFLEDVRMTVTSTDTDVLMVGPRMREGSNHASCWRLLHAGPRVCAPLGSAMPRLTLMLKLLLQ